MNQANVDKKPAGRPRLKITGAEFLLIGVPVSREEFRESLRPLAKRIALMIFEEQMAKSKNQGKETPILANDDKVPLNPMECGAQSLRNGKETIPAVG